MEKNSIHQDGGLLNIFFICTIMLELTTFLFTLSINLTGDLEYTVGYNASKEAIRHLQLARLNPLIYLASISS